MTFRPPYARRSLPRKHTPRGTQAATKYNRPRRFRAAAAAERLAKAHARTKSLCVVPLSAEEREREQYSPSPPPTLLRFLPGDVGAICCQGNRSRCSASRIFLRSRGWFMGLLGFAKFSSLCIFRSKKSETELSEMCTDPRRDWPEFFAGSRIQV